MDMDLQLSLVLDVLVAILLIATIIYAIILNRKLGRLRADRAEFETMIARFVDATQKADAGLKGLKATAEEVGRSLQQPTDRAVAIRDELVFMIERADALAEKLANRTSPREERGVAGFAADLSAANLAGAAHVGRGQARVAPEEPVDESDEAGGRSKAERDLLRALRNAR